MNALNGFPRQCVFAQRILRRFGIGCFYASSQKFIHWSWVKNSWFLRTFRHLTYSLSYRGYRVFFWGGRRGESRWSSVHGLPHGLPNMNWLSAVWIYTIPIFTPRTDLTEVSFSQKALPRVNSLILWDPPLANIAFRRNCFIWIDLINHTSPICNYE